MGPALKDILVNYGCDAACMDGMPLDVVTIAQATAYCACPTVIEVEPYNMKKMDISKILKASKIPEFVTKKSSKAALSLVATPEAAPQTSYMSSGLVFAAILAGGFVYNKKRSNKEDDKFASLI